MKFEPITIKDIAKALNLSPSTISKALRDSYEISPQTKQIVNEYARKINYRPNLVAVSLKERRTRSIGLVVPDLANSFFSQVIDGIDAVAFAKGYNVIIAQSRDSFEREIQDLEFLTARGVDGLLISVTDESLDHDYIHSLHQRGLPIVLFDRVVAGIDTHRIFIDNKKGGYDATMHLVNNGYKRIAALTSTTSLSGTKDRLEGYREALIQSGNTINEQYIKHCSERGRSYAEVEQQIRLLLSLEKPPEALITMGDRITLESLRFIRRSGIRIPADLALVGFSNLDISEITEPQLTIIRQPAFEIGKTAIELLLETVESRKPVTEFRHIVLQPEMIIRNSGAARK